MEGKITEVKLYSGDEGYKVCCNTEIPSMNRGDYEMPSYDYKEFFFSEDKAKDAFDKFQELDKIKKGEE